MFGFCSYSWHRAPKTLGISKMIRAMKMSFIILNNLLSATPEFILEAFGKLLVARETNLVIRRLELSAPPYLLGCCSVTQICPTLCDPVGCCLPGSSVHGISLARIPEWAAISSSRGSSQPRIEPMSPALAGEFFYHCTTWEAQIAPLQLKKKRF